MKSERGRSERLTAVGQKAEGKRPKEPTHTATVGKKERGQKLLHIKDTSVDSHIESVEEPKLISIMRLVVLCC